MSTAQAVKKASKEYLKLVRPETPNKNRKLFEAVKTLYADRKVMSEIRKREKALKEIILSYIVLDTVYKVGAYVLKWTMGSRSALNQTKLKEKYPEAYAACYEKNPTNSIGIKKD